MYIMSHEYINADGHNYYSMTSIRPRSFQLTENTESYDVPTHFRCDQCTNTLSHYLLTCDNCGKVSCCKCAYMANVCSNCGVIFTSNTIFKKTSLFLEKIPHNCKLQLEAISQQYLNVTNSSDISICAMHRKEILKVRRYLNLLSSPGLSKQLCHHATKTIVSMSQKFGDNIKLSFENLEITNRHLLDNLALAGRSDKIDTLGRSGNQKLFLDIYNELTPRPKQNNIVKVLKHCYRLTSVSILIILLFLQIHGTGATEAVLKTKTSYNSKSLLVTSEQIAVQNNLYTDSSLPTGTLSYLGKDKFFWLLGHKYRTLILPGNKVNCCAALPKSLLQRAVYEMQESITCNELSQKLSVLKIKNHIGSHFLHYKYRDKNEINISIDDLLDKASKGGDYLTSALQLSEYDLTKRIKQFHFQLSDGNAMCRVSFCQAEDTFTYNVFYKKIVELNKTEFSRNNVILTCLFTLYILYLLKLFISIFYFL